MSKVVSTFLLTLGFLVFASATKAAAAPASSHSPRFEITRYDISGNSLLSSEKIDDLLVCYIGKDKDFADVQHALEVLEKAYKDLGYGSVQVVLPEQELDQGIVYFKVIEARIRSVQIEGNKNRDEKNIRDSLPAVVEGEVPNSRKMAENLRVANENPS